ncbi:aminotransferase-like domain-containing protein [Actinomadura parmotrematis]|uniref:PLP-dependent aminotransferase family protein n=1 Tax=Actinomadura parmotrematis TaxID=2864039 RepID=A0ABS7FVD0_9ACTN|nr:PLP-dependent aminotransferase family protein [Actinomadura parmotrematis]MBW8483639.1 PLP-dependent aminotransferase family protein [Actinomadura parmotrematis]
MHNDSSAGALADVLRPEVLALRPGERLPSSRTLTGRHKVSPVTVTRALGLLVAEGLVVTRPGAGAFAADRPDAAPGPPDLGWQAVALGDRAVDAAGVSWLLSPPPDGTVALSGGYPHPSLQPLRALAAATARAARRPAAWSTPPLAGVPELRAWFAQGVAGAAPADVLIAAGGQQALTTVLRAVPPPGSPLLVESPTYLGALAVARACGLQPVPVPVDGEGVRPDLLAEAFALTGARALYCQPTFHNPTGATMGAARRARVLEAARAAGAFVIEDDYARHLAVDAPPPPLAAGDRDGRVVHIASLAKAVAPSVRIAAVIARGPVAERIRATQLVEGFFPSRPLQEALLELVGSPAWARHLRELRTALRGRRDALAAALARDLPGLAVNRPPGGLHLWARLPAGADDVAVTEVALRAGVLVSPGRPFFPAEPPAAHLRLTYGAAGSAAELEEGVRRLATVLPEAVAG